MHKILKWLELNIGGRNQEINLDYAKIIIIALLLYHIFWQA